MSSFIIVQTKEQTELAVSVHRNSEIKDIRLARSKVSSEHPDEALKRSLELEVKVMAKSIERPPLTVEVNFRVAVRTKGQTKKEGFSVDCVFQVQYELRPGFNPTKEQVKAFTNGNAIFNCWPYCRQYVQETVTRMGFPPAILPFLRVRTAERKKGQIVKRESGMKGN